MNCPKCNGKTNVIETRSDGKGTYRRRRCKACKNIFYTREILDNAFKIRQVTSDEARKRYYENYSSLKA